MGTAAELDAIERIWLSLRETCLAHPRWPAYDDILDARGRAWNALLAEPARIRFLCALDGVEAVALIGLVSGLSA